MKKANEEKKEKKVFTHTATQSKQVNTKPKRNDNAQKKESQEEKNEFNYFYGIEVERFNFYRIPKLLFTDERFKSLSCEAKVLYGLMLDRTSLSIKNKWLDEQKRVYIIFTQEDTMEYLNCAKGKASKLMKELTEIGLIEVKRQGLNKPNIIYVKNFFSVLTTKSADKNSSNADKNRKFENRTSRSLKIELPEVRKSNANNTDLNETNLNKNENLILSSQTSKDKEPEQTRQDRTEIHISEKKEAVKKAGQTVQSNYNISQNNTYTLEAYEKLIKENIEYDSLCNAHPHDKKFIDDIVFIMLDVIMSENKMIIVAGERKNAELVKSVFLKLNYYQLEYVIEKYQKVTSKIKKIKQYILTMLFNARLECEASVINEVATEEPIIPDMEIKAIKEMGLDEYFKQKVNRE